MKKISFLFTCKFDTSNLKAIYWVNRFHDEKCNCNKNCVSFYGLLEVSTEKMILNLNYVEEYTIHKYLFLSDAAFAVTPDLKET